VEIVHKELTDYHSVNSDSEDEPVIFHSDVLKMFRYIICLNYVLHILIIYCAQSQRLHIKV